MEKNVLVIISRMKNSMTTPRMIPIWVTKVKKYNVEQETERRQGKET